MKHLLLFIMTFSVFQTNIYSNITNNSLVLVEETITFPSGDGLTITADTYIDTNNSEFILLCHQAGYSRGEYINIAPTLVGYGYNCMAIDQRSGNQVNGVINQTHLAAQNLGLPTNFTDTIQDIEAAINKAYELNNNNPIYLLGSSYSSSLSLVIGRDNPKVKATLAFSPGEYFGAEIDVSLEISSYSKPIFVTSSQSESNGVTNLTAGVDSQYLTHFIPTVVGRHGASVLWSSTTGNGQYWTALLAFLSNVASISDTKLIEFSIYPNPTNGRININVDRIQKIEIFNILGEKIKTFTNTNKIDLYNQNKGIYFIKIYTENGIGNSKFILK